jgi:glutamate 5-kinase
MQGESVGTLFHPLKHTLKGRKRWILAIPCKGEVWIDDGAVSALRDRRKSLFAAGILKVEGTFNSQDGVRICDKTGFEVARGLPNYDVEEARKLAGRDSSAFDALLGYHGPEEIIHRDNIALVLGTEDGGASTVGDGDLEDDL